MKFYDVGSIALLIFFGLSIIINAGQFVYSNYYGDDNEYEEKLEEEIKDKTGLDVDLTPSSPEKK